MALGSGNKRERAINKLPEEILLSILSLLPMNELARSSLVSRQWNHYWRHLHVLDFDDPVAFNKILKDALRDFRNHPKVIDKGRTQFMNWVDSVINNHLGSSVDEFKLVFYLNDIPQHVIDGWVLWAFSKKVERLHIDFDPHRVAYAVINPDKHKYVLDLPMLKSCDTKFHLTSLCLKRVHVTSDAVEWLLRNCDSLESLCIHKSPALTRIGAASLPSLPSLKYCKIYDCTNLEAVDIRAPKLVTFKYYSGWNPVLKLLNIERAPALSRVSIRVQDEACFLFVLRSLYKYFPQLEYLKLAWLKITTVSPVFGKFPVLGNLKHLKLFSHLTEGITLEAWVPFIGACPLLQKLTLELRSRMLPVWAKNLNHDRCPLLHLKTLEIRHFNGANVDLDIVNFVLQNASALQEVIVYPVGQTLIQLDLEAPLARVCLTLPLHVKLVVV